MFKRLSCVSRPELKFIHINRALSLATSKPLRGIIELAISLTNYDGIYDCGRRDFQKTLSASYLPCSPLASFSARRAIRRAIRNARLDCRLEWIFLAAASRRY